MWCKRGRISLLFSFASTILPEDARNITSSTRANSCSLRDFQISMRPTGGAPSATSSSFMPKPSKFFNKLQKKTANCIMFPPKIGSSFCSSLHFENTCQIQLETSTIRIGVFPVVSLKKIGYFVKYRVPTYHFNYFLSYVSTGPHRWWRPNFSLVSSSHASAIVLSCL